MLAGMYVVHAGDVCQVAGISGGTIGYTGPSSSLYALAPVDGSPWRYVRDPLATEVPLTPACEACGLPAGHNKCTPEVHDGPRQPRQLAPLQPARPMSRREAQHGAECTCWRWDCGECGRRMHDGQRRKVG